MDEIKKWNSNALELFVALLTVDDPAGVQKRIDEVKTILRNLMTMIHELCKQSESCDDIGELMEKELGSMDKAIEEAAARIEVSQVQSNRTRSHNLSNVCYLSHVGTVVQIEGIRFRHQIRSKREDFRCVYGFDEEHSRAGEAIAYPSGRDRCSGQGHRISNRILQS